MRVRRRLNDFGSPTPTLLQIGTTTCCCCLHMIGAAVGGIGGLVTGMRCPKDAPPLRPSARQAVNAGAALGVVLMIFGIIAITVGAELLDRAYIGQFVLGAVVFVPSLCVLPIGLTCIAAAFLEQMGHAREYEGPQGRGGFRYAIRISVHLIVWSTTLAGVGYLIMGAISIFA